MQNKIREEITNRITEALLQGTSPWRMPWTSGSFNLVSKKKYRGINVLLLNLHRQKHQLESPFYATFKQWQEWGFNVKKRPENVREGQWGASIIFYNINKKTKLLANGEEKEITIPFLRTYTVFNGDQVEGNKENLPKISQVAPNEICQKAEEVIQSQGANIKFGGDVAAYMPHTDEVLMPVKERFSSLGSYYGTMFHELVHWTGAESRLKRLQKFHRFGTEAYAVEELVAEMGGCFMLGELGLPIMDQLENHASYIQNWLKLLENDDKIIFQAATAASAAVDFLLKTKTEDE